MPAEARGDLVGDGGMYHMYDTINIILSLVILLSIIIIIMFVIIIISIICIATFVGDELNKRGLEYGVRAPVFYGNLRKQTGEHISFCEHLQEACVVLAEIYEHLRKPPAARENVI